MSYLVRCTSYARNINIRRIFFTSGIKNSVLDVNTKVPKDVILFKYENAKFYRVLNAFGVVQFGLMLYMSNFVYTSLKDAPVSNKAEIDKAVWWKRVNLGEEKYRRSFATLCLAMGCLVLCGAWMFTLRSVRFLVLRKGGQSVSFVTYTPFGANRITTVPLSKVSSMESRLNAKVQLPIKVKGHLFHYMLDMKQGDFVKKDLYDASVGLYRNLK